MVIEALAVRAPCFGGSIDLRPWKRVNFVFGANGSGKTSISQFLSDDSSSEAGGIIWTDGARRDIHVFNRHYIERVLRESPTMPGVFTVDDSTSTERDRLIEIDGLAGADGELAKAERQHRRLVTTLKAKTDSERDAFSTLRDLVWPLRNDEAKMPKLLHPALVGTLGDRSKLANRLLETPDLEEGSSAPDLTSLLAEANSIAGGAGVTYLKLTQLVAPDLEKLEGRELLVKRLVGKQDASFADLVTRLDAQDWVNAGRSFVSDASPLCPFCQQDAPADLAAHLGELFDRGFEDDLRVLRSLRDKYDAAVQVFCSSARSAVATSATVRVVDLAAVEPKLVRIEEVARWNVALIESKISKPSVEVVLEAVKNDLSEVCRIIETANEEISAHNERARDHKRATADHYANVWSYFAHEVAALALASYKDGRNNRAKVIAKLREKVRLAEVKAEDLRDERSRLQESLHSSHAAIASLNSQLRASGFTSFEIADAGNDDGSYRLQRGAQPTDAATLSEGEANFIAFLYFLQQIQDTTSRFSSSSKIIVVIDDPISSLDSDVLHLVTSLTLRLVDDVENGRGLVEQLIILTHNVQFHREAAYQPKINSDHRTYRVIRKASAGPNTVENFDESPISSTYELLWADVRAAARGTEMTTIGLENLLRRILEYYFKTLGGGQWKSEFESIFSMQEQFVARALMKWADGGSHTVPDEIHYSPSPVARQLYLDVFARLFTELNHEGHYKMMMRIP